MPFDLPPAVPGIEISVATRGMSKGIAQTDGGQLIGKGGLRFGDMQAGLQWKNVDASTYDGEGSAIVALSHRFGRLQLSGSAAYKFATGAHGPTDSGSWEFTAGATRKFGPVVAARLNAVFSPDDLGSARRSLFVEAGPVVQLGKGWTASGAVGHRSRQNGVDYTAFNAGVGKSLGRVQLDLRYYDTNRSGVGEFYRGRIVGAVKLAF
jgi:hypothetical protein